MIVQITFLSLCLIGLSLGEHLTKKLYKSGLSITVKKLVLDCCLQTIKKVYPIFLSSLRTFQQHPYVKFAKKSILK